MIAELSSKFTPSFDAQENQIDISNFSTKGGKIKNIVCSDPELGNVIIKTMLNIYEVGYGDNRLSGTLTADQKENLRTAFQDTTYNGSYINKIGMIPELLLQIYRNMGNNNYRENINGLGGTTKPGSDFFEIIYDGENYLSLFRDARSDISNNARTALISKIKVLGNSNKRGRHVGLINQLNIDNKEKKQELKSKILHIEDRKVIFLVSESNIPDGELHKFDTYLQFLYDLSTAPSDKRIIEDIIASGNYIPYYVLVQINDYRSIIKNQIVGDDNRSAWKFIKSIV